MKLGSLSNKLFFFPDGGLPTVVLAFVRTSPGKEGVFAFPFQRVLRGTREREQIDATSTPHRDPWPRLCPPNGPWGGEEEEEERKSYVL